MTNEERIRNIQRLGYTEREAHFLCLVALHSGCFLRWHYSFFLGQEPGGAAERLIEKAVAKGHLTIIPSADRTRIYHLSARPFYKAIGQEDNRNRRSHEPYAILHRLLALNFVLAHPSFDYLATEQERVDSFLQLGIDCDTLPAKLYASPNTSRVTTRYFVDKNPIFLSALGEASARRVVHFCYVDPALGRSAGFEPYLRQYQSLMAALPTFALVYVSRDPSVFEPARRTFERLACSLGGVHRAGNDTGRQRLLAYFEARQDFEAKRYAQFDQKRLDDLREARDAFRGAAYEALYRTWCEGEEITMQGSAGPDVSAPAPLFSTYQIAYPYECFGALAQAV